MREFTPDELVELEDFVTPVIADPGGGGGGGINGWFRSLIIIIIH